MPSMNTILMAVAITLASSVNAHISLLDPPPHGNATSDQIKVPIVASSFPCHFDLGVYDDKMPPTSMAIGAPQKMKFKGSAVHGGGSCQISLTTDKRPTKDTKWEVINSIIGGCPIDVPANLPEAQVNDPVNNTINYTIPDSFQPGDYTLAWSWFNLIGNLEMYMNCAPITLTGGPKKREVAGFSKRADSLPEMFVANIGGGYDCKTTSGVLLDFPNPGTTVQHFGAKVPVPPSGSDCGTRVSASTASGASGAAPPADAPEAPSGSANSGAPPAPVTPEVPAAPAAPVASTAPVAPAAPAPAPAPAPAAPAPASPNANSSAGSCTSPGQSVCSPDGKQIGTCDATNHVTFMAVADGTVCKDGYMVMAKRSAKFAHGHIRRGHSLGRW